MTTNTKAPFQTFPSTQRAVFQSCSFIFSPHISSWFLCHREGRWLCVVKVYLHPLQRSYIPHIGFLSLVIMQGGGRTLESSFPASMDNLEESPVYCLLQAFMYHALTLPEVPMKPRWVALGACVKGNGDWQDGAVMLYMSLQENLQRRISQLLWSFGKLYIHQKTVVSDGNNATMNGRNENKTNKKSILYFCTLYLYCII